MRYVKVPSPRVYADDAPYLQRQETSRLLYDEPFRSRYGAVRQHPRAVNQPDPELLRREREALEEICHAMSELVALTHFGQYSGSQTHS